MLTMFHVFACAVCGGDPAVDTMLVNGVISGAIAAPWILRAHIGAAIRRVRRHAATGSTGDACPAPTADMDDVSFEADEDDSSTI